MKARLAASLIAVAVLAGCGEPAGKGVTVAPGGTASEFPWPADDLAQVEAKFGPTVENPSGLRWQPITPGTGDAHPRPGETVSAHYRGMFLDGSVFDESYKRGAPYVFQVGRGRVIKGWDEALMQMTRGERRRLVIPYWLAYGEAGRPPTIPARATLVFEVELVGWESAATQ